VVAPDPLRVAFICTGNRFRSPLAEALFQRAAVDVPVQTMSRGTLDLGAVPPLVEAMEEAGRLGLDLSSHRTRGLEGEDLSSLDLIVGFERMHVVAAVVEAKGRRDRTFTLPELVLLLESTSRQTTSEPVEHAREVLAAAAAMQRDPYSPPEIVDPLGHPRRVFQETADEVDSLVRRLAHGLFER
jgi:protein-tyrosine-phosphatase